MIKLWPHHLSQPGHRDCQLWAGVPTRHTKGHSSHLYTPSDIYPDYTPHHMYQSTCYSCYQCRLWSDITVAHYKILTRVIAKFCFTVWTFHCMNMILHWYVVVWPWLSWPFLLIINGVWMLTPVLHSHSLQWSR